MPTTFVAPLMSALPVTFLLVGSIQTSDLPSISPMMDAADAALAKIGAAKIVPASASAFSLVCMNISCLLCSVERWGDRDGPRSHCELRHGTRAVAVAGESRLRETTGAFALLPQQTPLLALLLCLSATSTDRA